MTVARASKKYPDFVDPRTCIIYAIRNKINGHSYVGSTVLTNRYQQHLSELKTKKHRCTPLLRAWNKYGSEAFECVTLKELGPCSNLDRDLAEIKWISTDGYYNLIKSSDNTRSFTHCPEICQKISRNLSEALKKPEHRATKKRCSLEMWQNPVTRANVLNSLALKYADPIYLEWWLSRIQSKESIEKRTLTLTHKWSNDPEYHKTMSEAAKRDRAKPESKIRMSKQTLKNFENPETRAKHKKSTKESWLDPVKYANHVAGFRTPEARENRRAAARRGWIKRYAKRNLKALAQAKADVQACIDIVSKPGS